MGRVIFVTAFKGGVGKTTVSAGIATGLAAIGKKVCVLDADFGMRCMDLILGMQNEILYDCSDVLSGRCGPDDAIAQVPGQQNMWFMPAPIRFDGKTIEKESADSLFDYMRERFDFCIVDSSAELTDYYRVFASAADEAIVVTLHQSTAIRAAEKTAANLADFGHRNVHLIVNCYREKEAENGKLPALLDIIYRSAVPLIGVVPFYDEMTSDQESGVLALSGRNFRKLKPYEAAYLNISCRICGKQIPLHQGVKKPGRKKKCLQQAMR